MDVENKRSYGHFKPQCDAVYLVQNLSTQVHNVINWFFLGGKQSFSYERVRKCSIFTSKTWWQSKYSENSIYRENCEFIEFATFSIEESGSYRMVISSILVIHFY
jgi:hypothetical protein